MASKMDNVMNQIKEKLTTFNALCVGLIFLSFVIVQTHFLPSFVYYFVLQSTFVFLALALGLSVYFNKSKLFVLLFFPLFFNLALAFPTTLFSKLSTTSFWLITPLTTSLGYLVIYALKERGLFSPFGAIRVGIGLFFTMGSYIALKNFTPAMAQGLSQSLLPKSISGLIPSGDFVLIMALIALGFILAISQLFEANTQKAPFWMLLAQLIPSLLLQDKNGFILFSLVASLIAIAALAHDAYRMAYIDTLTNIPARRALEEAFLRLGSRYHLAMVDIDHFKKFNDTYGHDIGDDVLKLIATTLLEVKNKGKVYRYGGEEFTILFHSSKHEECVLALEDIREKIAKRGFVIRADDRKTTVPKKEQKPPSTKKVKLSVSIGMATSRKGKTPHEILKYADEALYKAKESGRNCVISV
jgi:diguanylate cyclase (GGDEF)-like protein